MCSRIANKSPVRRTVQGARLKSTGTYYRILHFIYGQCREISGRIDRAMIDGRIQLPPSMIIESDAQSHMLNWTSRLDRRNVETWGYCSVETYSRFILGLHCNYDPDAEELEINMDAVRSAGMSAKEPYRKYARHWLIGDDQRAGRSKTSRPGPSEGPR